MIKNKLTKIAAVAFLGMLSFSSCSEDLDIWDSKTLEYAGTYDYQVLSEDESTVEESWGHHALIYNTAANTANTIFLEYEFNADSFKSVFNLTGDSSSFASSSSDFEDLPLQEGDDFPATIPTAVGETETNEYKKLYIQSGAIVANAATTTGGNTADSFNIKITCMTGDVTFTSYEIAEDAWADPAVPEFDWEITSAVHDDTLDETYVLNGYRYTGFSEDDH